VGVERPGLVSEQSTLIGGGIKNAQSYSSTIVQIMVLVVGFIFMAWLLINRGETIPFYFR
jgi:hypothetical protein